VHDGKRRQKHEDNQMRGTRTVIAANSTASQRSCTGL
jgi:hypothetical protein